MNALTPIYLNGEALVPGKILCIGRNYVDHITELGNDMPDDMVVFNKPASAISDKLLSAHGEPLHYETELCFVIRNGQLAGVGLGMDLTKRQLQSTLKQQGLPWERAKAFDGSATFSRFVTVPSDLNQLRFTLEINDKLCQAGEPSLMIYPPLTIIQELSKFTSLHDNDLIMTGTPKGVGEVIAGARYTARLFCAEQLLIEHQWIGQNGCF